jgi:hypothetical protein
MWSRFIRLFIGDINIILHDKKLLARFLAPVVIILLLKYIFPPFSGLIISKAGYHLDRYYSVLAVTLVSGIPMLIGSVCSSILLNEKDLHKRMTVTIDQNFPYKILLMRMMISVFISFVLVIITIILTIPVPTEGWLRTLFAASLLSIQGPFIFLFISALSVNWRKRSVFSSYYWIFLITVPLGLLLHHPWNYFTFFSPFYWISWAWVIPVPTDSFIYGAIAIVLTSAAIIILSGRMLRKKYTEFF